MIKYLRWPFLALLATLMMPSLWTGPIVIGSALEWEDGEYRFAGGTSPQALAIAAVTIFLYILLMYAPPAKTGSLMTGIVRRFVAFWLDFILAVFAIAPILGTIPTLVEWRRTGVFAWSFERATYASADPFIDVGITLMMFAALGFYFAWPLVRSRPSPGSCILGYQIVSDDGSGMTFRAAIHRMFRGSFALWFLEPFKSRRSELGKFRLDEKFGTHAVKLR
jgi:hypothetical protein